MVPFGYRFNGRWLQAVACSVCGLIFLHPRPSDSEVQSLYSAEYFSGDFRCGHSGTYEDSGTQLALGARSILKRIWDMQPGGRFLEIGCAGGAFLHAAKETGFEVAGIEISDYGVRFAREHFGLEVIKGTLAGAHLLDASFDIAYMGDVIEHLADPLDSLREVQRILRRGGLLVIHCPSQTNTFFSRLGFFAYHMLGKNAEVHLPPYHLFEYRPRSLDFLLCKTGFTAIQVQQGIIPPGRINLRGSVLERAAKKLLQYPNFAFTRMFGCCGDRLEVIARKASSQSS